MAQAVLVCVAATLALVGGSWRDGQLLAVAAASLVSQWLDGRGGVTGPRSRWRRWTWAVVAVALLAAAAALFAVDTWRTGGSATVLGVLAATRTGPRPASAPDPELSALAAGQWTPQRVLGAVGDPGDRVRAVRALRRADPRLSLTDAVRLVDAVRGTRPSPPS